MGIPTIRVVILDDQGLLRFAMRTKLAEAPTIEVKGEGVAGEDLERLLQRHHPDVVIMEAELPLHAVDDPRIWARPFDVVEAVLKARARHQGSRFLIVSSCRDENTINALLASGVNGYLFKQDFLSHRLVMAVRTIHNGGACFSPYISGSSVVDPPRTRIPDTVTQRQKEIFSEIINHPDDKYVDIAARMVISEATFRNHLRNARERLGVRTTRSAMLKLLGIDQAPSYLTAEPGQGEGDWPIWRSKN